jgi:hypothetical protein
MALPVALWGRFRDATLDRFAIDVAKWQRVSFEAVGNRLGKDVDPLVTIRDARGKIVAQRDNDPGLYFDFRFEHAFAEAGTYTVEMRDARFHGHEHGFYVLRMGKFPAARVALPAAIHWSKRFDLKLPGVEPLIPDRPKTDQENRYAYELPAEASGLFFGVVKRNGDDGSAWLPMEAIDRSVIVHQGLGNTIDDGTPAKVPAALCGILHKPSERHFFKLNLDKGQRILIRAEARAFNSPADLEIAITDAKGKELRRAGENQQTEEVVLDFTAGAPGVHGLTVRDINRDGGPAFAYRVDVRTPQPSVQVTADVEGLTVPRGDYQPVPLTITRDGHAGKIELKLVGAPPGVSLSPTEIDVGVNAVVCKLTAATDATMGIHTLQIHATPVTDTPSSPILVRTRPLIDKQIINVDLIPHALREDQRRLPPSLTDRFALQITPPSFFTFELPQPLATLGRYQHVEFPIAVTRSKGFDGRLAFDARGGQLAPKEEGRTRVYAEFKEDKGSIHSKILTSLTKHRVDVTAIGVENGRKIALTRTFDLDIMAAFTVIAEPDLLKLEPGATGKLRLNADRLKAFDGDVTIELAPSPGLEFPSTVVIPRGATGVDVEVKADSNLTAGKRNINLNITAQVNGFEEEQRGRFEVEIVKLPTPNK